MTLHEALEAVLASKKNEWTEVKDLAKAINQRKLYSMRDGRPAAPGQIHARVRDYAQFFSDT